MHFWQVLIEIVFVPILVNLISHVLEKLIDEKLRAHHQTHESKSETKNCKRH